MADLVARFAGYVDLALAPLPYTVPVPDGLDTSSLGLVLCFADVPSVSLAGQYDATYLAALQVNFLHPAYADVLNIGAFTNPGDRFFGGAAWQSWGGIGGLVGAIGGIANDTGSTISARLPASYDCPKLTFATYSTAGWAGNRGGCGSIRWQGTDYIAIVGKPGTGLTVLGAGDGTLLVDTILPDAIAALGNGNWLSQPALGLNTCLLHSGAGSTFVTVSNTDATAATASALTLAVPADDALFQAAQSVAARPMPSGWSVIVPGGMIVLASDCTSYRFFRFTAANGAAAAVLGDMATAQPWNTAGFLDADGRVWLSRTDTGAATQLLLSVVPVSPSPALAMIF